MNIVLVPYLLYVDLFTAAPTDSAAQETLLGNISSTLPWDQLRCVMAHLQLSNVLHFSSVWQNVSNFYWNCDCFYGWVYSTRSMFIDWLGCSVSDRLCLPVEIG